MRLLAFITLLLFASTSIADNVIVGAFGQKLGAVLELDNRTPDEISPIGGLCYKFDPNKPYPAFNTYKVCVTPLKEKIYSIYAHGELDNKSQCELQVDVIKVVLKEKYPTLKQSKDHGVIKFKQDDGERLIGVHCHVGKDTQTGNSNLRLYYFDREVKKQIVQEKASLVDKSNF